MRIRPLANKVLVRLHRQEATKGGILLPDSAEQKQRPQQGTVVAVGPGAIFDHYHYGDASKPEAVYKPMPVKAGDVVLVARYVGADLGEIEGLKDHVLADDRDILGVVEPDEPKAKK